MVMKTLAPFVNIKYKIDINRHFTTSTAHYEGDKLIVSLENRLKQINLI